MFVDDLMTQYRAMLAPLLAEFGGRFRTAADPALMGTMLDHVMESGLVGHAFNLSAATLARHEVLVPAGDSVTMGPASFDASYTPRWSQAGLCEHLRAHIFPLGIDARGSLSLRTTRDYPAQVTDDSPVECHDGMLTAFGMPSGATCQHIALDALVMASMPRGSVSRAFPPDYVSPAPGCSGLVVPGLPGPVPVSTDAGIPTADAGGDAGTSTRTPSCRCSTPGTGAGRSSWALLGLLGILAAMARRRRARVRSVVLATVGVLASVACGGPMMSTVDGGDSARDSVTAEAAADAADAPADMAPDVPDLRSTFLAALGDSVWQGMQARTEGTASKMRAYELRFRSSSLEWAEIRNPFGPARKRTLRSFSVRPDGRTVESTILSPAGWPVDPDNGLRETWTIELVLGTRRQLRITDSNNVVETFTEGAWPTPTTGLTAEVRTFAAGPVSDAFCTSGTTGFTYGVIWDFARGRSAQPTLGYDVVGGVPLHTWVDTSGANRFAVTDVEGFSRLGGTLLSDQSNFVVRYTGTMTHPGGTLAMRELDDSVEDALWVFLDADVGSLDPARLFLEVQGFVWPDRTVNVPSATLAAADVPIEILLVRCAVMIRSVDTQIQLAGGSWTLVGDAPSKPAVTTQLFPPAL